MTKPTLLALSLSGLLIGCGGNEPTSEAVNLDSEMQRISYTMGAGFAERVRGDDLELDVSAFAAGMRDVMEEKELRMTQEQMMQEMQAFQTRQMQKMQAAQEKAAEDNKAAGEAFLAENANKEGVVTTASGLQYKVLSEGSGEKPTLEDTVEVHYKGTLLDGTEFDSSYKRDATVSFPVKGVIAGWTEALQLMPVGSKWQLFIPSDLAYGPQGAGRGPIGPNATLIFEVELIDIKEQG